MGGSPAHHGIAQGVADLGGSGLPTDQVPASLGPLGLEVTDIVVGDVRDDDVVSQAIEGCEAVVHAAAVYSLDPRRAAEMRRTNARATELVLGRAVDRGLDPVVHVSTTVALTRYGGSGPDLPLGDIRASVRPVEDRLGEGRPPTAGTPARRL